MKCLRLISLVLASLPTVMCCGFLIWLRLSAKSLDETYRTHDRNLPFRDRFYM